MSIINLPYKFGLLSNKIILNNFDELILFLVYLSKIDYLCNSNYHIKKIINNNIKYLEFNINTYILSDYIFEDLKINDPNILIVDNNNLIYNNPIVIFNNNNKFEIYFNYNLSENYIIENLIKSFNVFQKTFDKTNYSLIEDENNFINKYHTFYDFKLNDDNITLLNILKKIVSENANKIAIKYKNIEITYSEFYYKIKILSKLIKKYVKKTDNITILMDKNENLIIVIWAILYSGCCFVPIDINDPFDRINYMINNSNSKLIITTNDTFQTIIPKILINKFNYNEEYDNEDFIDDNNDLAYILHTSGTTGNPKGVKISRKALLNFSFCQINILNMDSSDIILQKTPYIWDVSMRELITSFLVGATVVVTESEMHKDSQYILDLISNNKITFLHFVPSMLNIFLEFITPSNNLDSVKNIICSGEVFPDKLRLKFYKYFKNTFLYNMYGPTEASVEVTYLKCLDTNEDLIMTIGKPLFNNYLLIFNKDNKLLPNGLIGELIIGGVQVAEGYINQLELTNLKFKYNSLIADKIYKTGDLTRILNDNNIEYLGRVDSQIKIRGMRIEIDEIKNTVLKYEGIIDCYVSIYKKEHIICYISPENIIVEELKIFITKYLPKQMIPDIFLKINKFPIGVNGKLNTKELPIPSLINNLECNQIISKEIKDTNFLKIFSDILDISVDNLDIDQEIILLGLDSIKIMLLQSILIKNGYNITLNDIRNYKTIKNIYNNIKNCNKDDKKDIKYDIDYYFKKIDLLLDNDDKYVCIHSALYELELSIDDITILFNKLINKWISEGKTIFIPSFTTSNFNKTRIFNKDECLNETGILAEIIFKMENSTRTLCPLYSFVIIGDNKDIFMIHNSETSFGKNSIFELFEKYNVKIFSIGTSAMTQFHRYEEIYNVPYRHFKEFNGIYINKNIEKKITKKHFIRNLNNNVENLSDNDILNILGNKIKYNKIGSTYIKSIEISDMKRIFENYFKDLFILVKNKKNIIDYYTINNNYIFDIIKVNSSPIINHFFYDREIENLSTDFYQYIILNINFNYDNDIILKKIENILFHFSPLYYIFKKNEKLEINLDFNLRKLIKNKFRIINKLTDNIENIINYYSKELDIYNGDNFRILLINETNELVIIINHFCVDGISWRLLINNLLNDNYQSKNNYEERTRFDTWTNELNELNKINAINFIDNEINYWNNIINKTEKFNYDLVGTSYSNKYSVLKTFNVKISDHKLNINLRNYVLSKLLKTLFVYFNGKSITLNIETHGREDITYINNLNDIFGFFTSYFPMIFETNKISMNDIENKFNELYKNGIYYLLLRYNFIKKYNLETEKNKVEILFNFMGEFNSNSELLKISKIGEKGDNGHVLTFWIDIKSNNYLGCELNINLYYLSNFINEDSVNFLIDELKKNLLFS